LGEDMEISHKESSNSWDKGGWEGTFRQLSHHTKYIVTNVALISVTNLQVQAEPESHD